MTCDAGEGEGGRRGGGEEGGREGGREQAGRGRGEINKCVRGEEGEERERREEREYTHTYSSKMMSLKVSNPS